MPDYLLLFRGGKTHTAGLQELVSHEERWDDWMDDIESKAELIDGRPLRDTGVLVAADGMYESNFSSEDSVTGYLILACNDLEEAVDLASDCPIYEFGGKVEVREMSED